MKRFIGTKIIKAKEMNRQEYNDYRGWSLPDDEDGGDTGYLVEYFNNSKPNHADHIGHVSWSPSEQFEEAYKANGEMSFGHAVDLLKIGAKVTRSGWNGSDMFVYYVPSGEFPALTEIAKAEFGATVPYRAYLALRTAQGDVCTWVPSISDVLANDWGIV